MEGILPALQERERVHRLPSVRGYEPFRGYEPRQVMRLSQVMSPASEVMSILPALQERERIHRLPSVQFENNYFTEMCSGSEAGSYLRLIVFVYATGCREGSNRMFQVLDLYWCSPRPGDLWYKSRQLKKRFDPTLRRVWFRGYEPWLPRLCFRGDEPWLRQVWIQRL